jgi:hypothetical protein
MQAGNERTMSAERTMPGPDPSTRRAVLAGAGAITLTALVAAASGAYRSESARLQIGNPRWVVDVAVAGIVVLGAVTLVVLFFFFLPAGGGGWRTVTRMRARSTWRERMLLTLLVLSPLLAATLAVSIGSREPPPPVPVTGQPPEGPRIPGSTNEKSPAQSERGGVDWWVVAALVAAAGGGASVAAGIARRRRHPGAPGADGEEREQLLGAIDDSLDALAAEPDARRAVVAAYARMERLLARVAIQRAPYETPLEYLQRLMVRFGGDARPAAELTDLFEEAKFSHHPVSSAMKQRALTALIDLRASVQPS